MYNVLAAAAIQNHILPYLQARLQDPCRFSTRVVGDVGNSLTPSPLLEITGRLPDVESGYIDVDFALCPLPAGTGQNVKIVEALSRGLPVITYGDIGRSANVIHGVNGLLANSPQEMRDYVLELVEDDSRLRALKKSTRNWAAKNFVLQRFTDMLNQALHTTGFQISAPAEETKNYEK